jgi:uncharacterized protein (TIGR02646 family)
VIRIIRPQEPPEVLTEEGRPLVQRMLAEYRADPPGFQDGSKTFAFERDVYGHQEVRERLRDAQHRKCCYCEVRIISESGDIEHFRPKASVQQGPEHRKQSPGYFWLAYSWSNLLYACSRCNREYKRDLFPLEEPSTRADALHDEGSTDRETPLLLDPTAEDPQAFIEFDAERALARGGAPRGRVTIDLLGLNRTMLLEERRDRLESIRERVECLRLVRAGRVQMNGPDAHERLRSMCQAILAATEERAQFSGMIRCAVRRWVAPALDFPCTEEDLLNWALPRVSQPDT